MQNHQTTTKMLAAPGPMAIGPMLGVFAYGRVSTAANARPRGGVLRWFPSR